MASSNDFITENLADWSGLLKKIFNNAIPLSAKWTNLADVVAVLNTLGSISDSNHMFYPDGGGMDLESAKVSTVETGCIELHTGGATDLVKPSELSFESFGDDFQWAYFRLECEPLKASGVYPQSPTGNEEVTELTPGDYVTRSAWDENSYHGQELPETARVLVRHLVGGPLVIFAKGSIYNQTSSTYDGRHAKGSASEFRSYIARSAEAAR